MFKFTGEVRHISKVQQINKDLKKQSINIVTLERSTPIKIDFYNQKCDQLKDLLIGKTVYLTCNLQGNYDKDDATKVYNSFSAVEIKTF